MHFFLMFLEVAHIVQHNPSLVLISFLCLSGTLVFEWESSFVPLQDLLKLPSSQADCVKLCKNYANSFSLQGSAAAASSPPCSSLGCGTTHAGRNAATGGAAMPGASECEQFGTSPCTEHAEGWNAEHALRHAETC